MISTVDSGISTVSPATPKAPPPEGLPLTEPSSLCRRGGWLGGGLRVFAAVSIAFISASWASPPMRSRQLAGRRSPCPSPAGCR